MPTIVFFLNFFDIFSPCFYDIRCFNSIRNYTIKINKIKDLLSFLNFMTLGVGYIETNEMIRRLSLHLKAFMEDAGHESIVIPATHNWDEEKLISDWSHRHVAYITGIGRFGLNNMLITDQGSCGECHKV